MTKIMNSPEGFKQKRGIKKTGRFSVTEKRPALCVKYTVFYCLEHSAHLSSVEQECVD